MPRRALPRLSARHAAKLRAAISGALDDGGKTLEDLGDAIDQGRDYKKRSIDIRTLRRHVQSDEPLARKVAAELWRACAFLEIYSPKVSAAVNEITAGDPRPLVMIVPSERRGEMEATLATLGAQELATLHGDRTQIVLIPGLGLVTCAEGAEVFVVPKRPPRSRAKTRRRR